MTQLNGITAHDPHSEAVLESSNCVKNLIFDLLHHLQPLPEHRFLLKNGRTKFCTRTATALVCVPG